jgi:hypothetical protein
MKERHEQECTELQKKHASELTKLTKTAVQTMIVEFATVLRKLEELSKHASGQILTSIEHWLDTSACGKVADGVELHGWVSTTLQRWANLPEEERRGAWRQHDESMNLAGFLDRYASRN